MYRIIVVLLVVLATGFSGCTLLKVNVLEELQPFEERVIAGSGKYKVLVIDLTGVIMGSDSGGFMEGKKPSIIARMRELLDRARSDHDVKAVVLRINSPGGGVTASDTLYHELKRFKEETGVVVVAHIMDVGASGAYYTALAADAITAQPTSVTGSIGVIMYRVDATALMQKIGVQALAIASGDRKGLGSPFRPMSDDERRLFQGVIDTLYGRFAGLVATERKMTPEAVKAVADGRILLSDEAKKAGLIDGVGYLDDAVALARKKANLSEASVIMYLRPGEYRSNLYSQSLVSLDLGEFLGTGPQFLYLWWP